MDSRNEDEDEMQGGSRGRYDIDRSDNVSRLKDGGMGKWDEGDVYEMDDWWDVGRSGLVWRVAVAVSRGVVMSSTAWGGVQGVRYFVPLRTIQSCAWRCDSKMTMRMQRIRYGQETTQLK